MFRSVKMSMIGVVIVLLAGSSTGCAVNVYKYRPQDKQTIKELSSQVDKLSSQYKELENAKRLLEQQLAGEISNNQVNLQMEDRGLVISFITEILFNSGKAELRNEAHSSLDKVSSVIKNNVSDREIGIEGHTDNEPIRRSGWRSNWELSTSRSTSVLHYLVDKGGLDPKKLAATGYGEYRPVASNSTQEGRQKNRRVEIIIMPKTISKVDFEAPQQKKPAAQSDSYIK